MSLKIGYRTMLVVLLGLTGLLTTPRARSAPGLGAAAGGIARAMGAGGVIIDYRHIHQAPPLPGLDVDWHQGELVVAIEGVRHRLPLADWEMAELLRVTHIARDDGYLEVSIDRISDGAREFGTTPELAIGGDISDLGYALLRADVEYAHFWRGLPPADRPEFGKISPMLKTMDLLESDPDYRNLTVELVEPPILMSQIKATVTTLQSSAPVSWTASAQLYLPTPQGQVIDTDDKLIDASMVDVARRPYRPLENAVNANGELAEALPSVVSALERVQTYALGLSALDGFCRRQPRRCSEWYEGVGDAVDDASFRVPSDADIDAYMTGIASSAVFRKWEHVRHDMVERAPSRTRALALLDELIYETTTGMGDRELIDMLLEQPLEMNDPAIQLMLDFHRDLDGLATGASPADMRALFEGIDDLPLDEDQRTSTREILASSAQYQAHIVGDETYERARNTLVHCIVELGRDSERARDAPESETATTWLRALSRMARCRAYPGMDLEYYLQMGAAFHYAIGINWARELHRLPDGDGRLPRLRRDTFDRLRVLRAHERRLRRLGDETKQREISKLIMDLHDAIRG